MTHAYPIAWLVRHALGAPPLSVERATDELVVLAKTTTLTGGRTMLAHHCRKTPSYRHPGTKESDT